MNTPQIAAFARLAGENTPPVSALEGQKTLISRTMHALEYDPVHDELCVNSPLNNAILTFRGGAKGEEPPVRVIQGPRTQIQSTGYDGNDKMAMDPAKRCLAAWAARNAVCTCSRVGSSCARLA